VEKVDASITWIHQVIGHCISKVAQEAQQEVVLHTAAMRQEAVARQQHIVEMFTEQAGSVNVA
jgi:hypothetical protein